MQGKQMVMAGFALSRVIDSMSKSLLADIIVDRIRAELGEDATDEQVMTHLQTWVDPVARVRNDRPLKLAATYQRYAAQEEKYREQVTQCPCG